MEQLYRLLDKFCADTNCSRAYVDRDGRFAAIDQLAEVVLELLRGTLGLSVPRGRDVGQVNGSALAVYRLATAELDRHLAALRYTPRWRWNKRFGLHTRIRELRRIVLAVGKQILARHERGDHATGVNRRGAPAPGTE